MPSHLPGSGAARLAANEAAWDAGPPGSSPAPVGIRHPSFSSITCRWKTVWAGQGRGSCRDTPSRGTSPKPSFLGGFRNPGSWQIWEKLELFLGKPVSSAGPGAAGRYLPHEVRNPRVRHSWRWERLEMLHREQYDLEIGAPFHGTSSC